MDAIHISFEIIREVGHKSINIGHFDLNVILIQEPLYNYTFIIMPSAATFE